MKKSLMKLSVIASLGVLGLTAANAGEFGIGAYGTKVDLKGNFTYLGNDISLNNDLNMNKKDTTVIPTLSYKTENSIVYIDYIRTEHKGSGVLSRTITFDDQTYTVGSNVKSSMKLDWGRLGFRTDVTDFGTNDVIGLRLGGDIHVIKLDTSIADATKAEHKSVTFGLPSIAAGIDVSPIKNVTLFADVAGLPLGSVGHYLEYDIGVKANCPIFKGVEWKAGYKSKEFDLEASDNEKAKLEFSGAYVGLAYYF